MKITILFFILVLARAEINRQKYSDVKRQNSRSNLSSRLSRVPSLSDVLEIYDYSFMSLVWPKLRNGVHLVVGPSCWEDMSVFYKDYLEGKQWAYSVVDASGRYNSGFFRGNRAWMGSIQQCYLLDRKHNEKRKPLSKDVKDDEYIEYSYAFTSSRDNFNENNSTEEWHISPNKEDQTDIKLETSTEPPFRLAYNTLSVTMNITKPIYIKPQKLTIGLCIPKTCSPDDIRAIIDFTIMVNDNLKSNRTITRIIKINEIRLVKETYQIGDDAVAITLILITIILVILCLFATAVDLNYIKWNPKSCRAVSFDIQKSNENLESQLESLKCNNLNYNRKLKTNTLAALKENSIDLDTLTINNINNYNNINLVTVKKMKQSNELTPKITLDVIAMEENKNSCRRCGKYRRQCPNPRHNLSNLPACPRMQQLTPTPVKTQKPSFCKSLLICFSLSHSWKRLCNTNVVSKELSAIHGLKILATLWMVYLHIVLIVSYVADNGENIFDDENTYNMTFHYGTLAFDTLFFVSGVLSSHHYYYLKSRYTVKELVSFGGSCGHALQLVCFVSNRAVRLIPPYAFVIFVNGVVSRVLRTTSPLVLPENDFDTCDRYWWKNLLYINTFYSTEERCMWSSWYLSVESQVHLVGTVVLVGAGGRGWGTVIAGGTVVIAALGGDLYVGGGDSHSVVDSFSAYTAILDRPLSRVAPYFIGLFTGWLIYKLDGILIIRKVTSTCLWIVSVSLWVGVGVSGGSGGAVHAGWGAAGVWPSLLVTTHWNEWSRKVVGGRMCACLSRLSYSVVLVHVVVARYVLLDNHIPLHITAANMWCYFAGITSVSLLFSLILSLLIETPCCSLLRRISDCANK